MKKSFVKNVAVIEGYPSAEFDVDTLYYQWVPFFLFFQVRVCSVRDNECHKIQWNSSAALL